MNNLQAKMSTTKVKTETPPASKDKPKKRSLIERELETSLTPQFTSPLQINGDGITTSRYGRARRHKSDMDFCDTEKAVSKVLQSPTMTRLPTKSSPAYKIRASNVQEKTESLKKILGSSLDNQIQNIYSATISLSRFGTEEQKQQTSPSPNCKSDKMYVRKDLIQTKEKEETVTLIKNMFSPIKSTKKPNTHLNNILERSSEKYNIISNNLSSKLRNIRKPQNRFLDTVDSTSVVKMLDFDSKKNKMKDGIDTVDTASVVNTLDFDSRKKKKKDDMNTVDTAFVVKADLDSKKKRKEDIDMVENAFVVKALDFDSKKKKKKDCVDTASEAKMLDFDNKKKKKDGIDSVDTAPVVKTLDFDRKNKKDGLERLDTVSVVKMLNFDSKKKKKKDGGESNQILSKNDLFELEATSPYQVGDIAWARMGTFPFWPCIVTREPESNLFAKKKLFGVVEHYLIHVTFFADKGRRSWIIDNMLRSYHGLDEFEDARDAFTPEAKKKDPKLYSAFFISDKKLALWHTSIEEADSVQREPKRLRVDIFNEMLMNPPSLILTPPPIQVARSGRITNRCDSDVSLSESLYDTLFSEDDGKNETPRNQRKKSLDVSKVVTACLDNMAAKTGITKIQRQSHMDIWLEKAKSKTPEKSQFNITIERVDQDKEKEKPKKENNRRKKWVPPREPLHKPYSFRKSTESQHLLAYQNEHDYSILSSEPENEQNSIQNVNNNALGSDTPPICVIGEVVSLKDIENELIMTEVHDDLLLEIEVQQSVESTKKVKIAKGSENVLKSQNVILTTETNDNLTTDLMGQQDVESLKENKIAEEAETVTKDENEILTAEMNANLLTEIIVQQDSESTKKDEIAKEAENITKIQNEILTAEINANLLSQKMVQQDFESSKEGKVAKKAENITKGKNEIFTAKVNANLLTEIMIQQDAKSKKEGKLAKEAESTTKCQNKILTAEVNADLLTEILVRQDAGAKKEDKIAKEAEIITNGQSEILSTKVNANLGKEKIVQQDEGSPEEEKNAKEPKIITKDQNEILKPEENANLDPKITVQQDVELTKQLKTAKEPQLKQPTKDFLNNVEPEFEVIQEAKFFNKKFFDEQIDTQRYEESKHISHHIDEVLTDRLKPVDNISEKETVSCESQTFTEPIGETLEKEQSFCESQPVNEVLEKETVFCESPTFTQPIDELTCADEQQTEDQSETLLDKYHAVTKSAEDCANDPEAFTQSVEKETLENESQSNVLSLTDNSIKSKAHNELVENNFLTKEQQVFAQSFEKQTVGNEPTQSNKKEMMANEPQAIVKSFEKEITAKEPQAAMKPILRLESDENQDYDDCDSEFSEPSPEYERLDEFMEEERNIKTLNNTMSMESIDLKRNKINTEEISELADERNVPKNVIESEILKGTQDLATPAKSKVSTTDDDRTSCNTTLDSNSSRLTPIADLKEIMEETEELVTPKKSKVTTFQCTNHDSGLKRQIPVIKLTKITEASEELITLNDILNKDQIHVNKLIETDKTFNTDCKVNEKSNEVPSDEDLRIVKNQANRGSAKIKKKKGTKVLNNEKLLHTSCEKILINKSNNNNNILQEKLDSSTVSEINEVRETIKIKKNKEITMNLINNLSKAPKIQETIMNNVVSKKGILEVATETPSDMKLPEDISITSKSKPVKKLTKVKIADITVANSAIILNGLDDPSDKRDLVTKEDSICDTYSLRSEISSLTMCGDDTNDKDFDPETISLSSLSSAISDASVVAPRQLTRKTSFHEGRQKYVAKNKDMDRIKRKLLQDSDNESLSSLEDVALSVLKTRSKDKMARQDKVTKLRDSIESSKSETSDKQLKIMVTDCMAKLKKNKLPKVKDVSSETDAEYEIINSPRAESYGSRKRISLRLKKLSPLKANDVLHVEQKDSSKQKTLFTEEKAKSIESANLYTDSGPVTRRKSVFAVSTPAEFQTDIPKDELKLSEKSLQRQSSQEPEIVDLTELPLAVRRKRTVSSLKTNFVPSESSPSTSKILEIGSLPNIKKSLKTIRIRRSSISLTKSSPESKSRYPTRKSISAETQTTSSSKVSNAFSQKTMTIEQNLMSNELKTASPESSSTGSKLHNKHETLNSAPPSESLVNGFHDNRSLSPDIQLKEPDLDSISVKSTDSRTSIKRKGKAKPEHEHMKEPEFQKYLEINQDSLMDNHPELTYEEIVAYLYKTWQYQENHKTDTKKTDELENTHFVKGVNEQVPKKSKPKQPNKNSNRIININKLLNKVSPKKETLDLLPRELPKRKASKPFYKEEFSDIEEEIKMFEIFKKKPKSTTPVIEPKQETEATKDVNVISSGPKEEIEVTNDVKKEINSVVPKKEALPVITSTKSELPQVDAKEEVEIRGEDEQYYDQEELYFEQLTKLKPNLFKGLCREKICEICEKTSNLVKCKGCNGMFHVDCVKKVDEPVEIVAPTRGRKKKNKPRGRKPKTSLDSNEESQSDEKPQDLNASVENVSFEAVKEVKPIVIIDLDSFETQLEAKMKEMIEATVEYDSYSSDDGIDWSETVAGKCEIIDVKLKPRTQPIVDNYDFKCKNCQEHDTPICFVCKTTVSSRDKNDKRQKCHVAHCYKYYHLECLERWPQTQFNAGELSRNNKNKDALIETLTCPRHVCHTCVSDDPRGCKTRFSGDKLARCVRCPATYHSFTKCLPAGSQILSAAHIVCPRHYQNRPGKVPYHVNTGWCFICALGGNLICCDFCPTSFHADCLNIEPPEGGYMCEDCETGRLPLYGEMVWVKLGHYRWWPGIVLHPSEIPDNIMAVKHSPGEFVVRFFGQYDHYWVNRGRVFPFQEGDSGRISTQKSKIDEAFIIAMEHAQRAFEILKNVEPNDEEDQDIQSSLLPPHYVKLKVNKPCGALYGKKIDIEEHSLTQCECNPDEEEPCGPYSHCLNRMLLTECGPTCRAGERCQNRQFEKREYPKLVPYRTPQRGWGLKTLEDIKAGQFVIEYVGELIDEAEFRRRMVRKHETRDENFYFLTLDKERMIDAGPKGNLARFMNHCCEPNCETQKWTVLGDVRVGLFAIDDIPANTEVTFNYNLECTGIEKKQCMCGAKRCAGYIGAKPKQEEPQPKKLKPTTKRVYKKRKNNDSPSTSGSDKSTKPKRPIGRPPKPKEPRELTEIEKDLLIIKNATNGLSSDSDGGARRESADIDSDKLKKIDKTIDKTDNNPLKRKRVSFSKDELVCNGEASPSTKKIKLDVELS